MSAAARVIDANANRAREALRVMEDSARFALNDAALSEQIKSLRHGLQSALATLPAGWLEANRDTPHDVGREVTGANEMQRPDYHAVVVAAGKRSGEALRSIEECLKTIDPRAASAVSKLRYAAYEAESALAMRMGSAQRRQWRVCVLITERLCARPWQDVLRAVVDGGACCIQVREKELSTRELSARVRTVVSAARASATPISVIVNDRADIALACGADGVHLGVNDLAIADARRLSGTQLLVGASTHSLAEAALAVSAGADYCGVGCMFPTQTKPGVISQGEAYLRAFIAAYPHIPHLAIGGVTPHDAPALHAAGARGVAVSSSVCGASDPGEVVRALRKIFA